MEVRANLVAYRGHMLPVWGVACCPHAGFYFASCGADRTARVWNTERAQALRILAGGWLGGQCVCMSVLVSGLVGSWLGVDGVVRLGWAGRSRLRRWGCVGFGTADIPILLGARLNRFLALLVPADGVR